MVPDNVQLLLAQYRIITHKHTALLMYGKRDIANLALDDRYAGLSHGGPDDLRCLKAVGRRAHHSLFQHRINRLFIGLLLLLSPFLLPLVLLLFLVELPLLLLFLLLVLVLVLLLLLPLLLQLVQVLLKLPTLVAALLLCFSLAATGRKGAEL